MIRVLKREIILFKQQEVVQLHFFILSPNSSWSNLEVAGIIADIPSHRNGQNTRKDHMGSGKLTQ